MVTALAWLGVTAGVGAHGAMAGAGANDMALSMHMHMEIPTHMVMRRHQHAALAGSGALPSWTLMAIAMMAPLALPAIRHVGRNSVRSRRQWAMALYFGVYVAVWVAFGVLALGAARLMQQTVSVDARIVTALALTAAGAWQLTRFKRRALFSCGATVPLAPVGRRADAACIRFALRQSGRCIKSCWALMFVMATLGHSGLAPMAALAAFVALEELTRVGRRLLRPSAAVLAMIAVAVAVGV